MLKIWGRRDAFNVQKVMWLVGELGLDHEHIPAGGSHGGLDDPAFRAMNPHGKVPVIDDEGVIVWESHTILRYLGAKFGGPDFWSPDATVRSEAERWMDWSATTLQPDFLKGIFWGWYRTPEDQRDQPAVDAKIAACAEHMQHLDRLLATRPWIGGDAFGLGDIPAGLNMFRYFGIGVDRPDIPHVEDWYNRLTERPAYREHVMLPFDHLKGRLAY
jgi:glutathione S-transferase